jgi:hypothetical protein
MLGIATICLRMAIEVKKKRTKRHIVTEEGAKIPGLNSVLWSGLAGFCSEIPPYTASLSREA